ncbi:CHAT domain-containing protein [Psychroserpens ponticola]|uniref:CHAT domain-containing protein n=1 Tax=Psychroserpens ponticola TaxID=2932268 RepID=A0ABY7S0W7_9FLAO|nr:CHAT domain-containing protein [Psychroserpens ponticola]WCO02809.1 CHAT domain-containing protein [Psychroserpens ponticola]
MSILKKSSSLLICCILCITSFAQQKISNTKIADSLEENSGQYLKSLPYRTLALEETNHSENYKKHIEAKWNFTKSCIHEGYGGLENHTKALEYSIKAREILNTSSNPSIWFKYQIANRIYHQYGYTQNWKMTLVEAKENLIILQDTLPEEHIKILRIIDDLGYINTKLNDYQTSLTYYNKSIALYKTHHKENKIDLAMNYNVLANNYKALGLKNRELNSLLLSAKYWEELDKRYNNSIYNTYKKLASWYLYYGDYNLAETYLNKQYIIIDSVKHKKAEYKFQRRHKYLDLYSNYIDLNLKKKAYVKAKKYIDLAQNELKSSTREFIEDVKFEALIYSYNSQLPNISEKESIRFLNEAIDLTTTYKAQFFLDPIPYQIALFEKYKDLKYDLKSEELLKSILINSNHDNAHEQFYLTSNYGNIFSRKGDYNTADQYFINAFKLLLKEGSNSIDLRTLKSNQLKDFDSFEAINSILLIAETYFNWYQISKNISHLDTSHNIYLLASDVLNSLYLGKRYNENLYNTYKSIENGLIKTLIPAYSEEKIVSSIEALEHSNSKLTWSKFLFNKQKHKLNIPDSILNTESDLKNLVNYYQNKLFSKDENSQFQSDALNTRLKDLKLELSNLQDVIKNNYTNYYYRNYNTFKLSTFRKTLNKHQLVIKYILNDNHLYCFTISKSNIDFKTLNVSNSIQKDVSNYVKSLSTFNSESTKYLEKLKPIIQPLLENNTHKNITIIPDEILNYLPFETLFSKGDFSTYNTSYASSLTLLNEQNNLTTTDELQIGIFSTNNSSSELPSILKETNSILNYFSGKQYKNTTKEAFLKAANHYDILHLAMHSNINNVNPDFSNLEFTDGNLLVSELYNETINSKLAVLSACESGSGNFEKGEGIQSISRAFTYTGIPSTVISLWKVDDLATSKIMSAFYKHLKQGNTKDEALKNAKLDYIKNTPETALQHPYYWAGFIISGNTDALVVSHSNYLYFGIAILFVVVLFFFFRKKS